MTQQIILVTGSRDWIDYDTIYNTLKDYSSDKQTLVITGDCRGVDQLTAKASKELCLETKIYPANWSLFGKRAGPIRNQKMVDEINNLTGEKIVLAFHDKIDTSKGTIDCINKASKKGLYVRLFYHDSKKG